MHPDSSNAKVSRLFDAIRNGDETTVELLVRGGTNVNSVDQTSLRTPLLEAIENDRPELVLLLLRLGADPNLPGRANETPLHCAVDMAVEIVNRKFDLGERQEKASTRIINILLEAGASPGSVDAGGRTPLDWAKDLGFSEAAVLLHTHGS